MKKSVAITREEWQDRYNGFTNESEDVQRFLVDYCMEMYGSSPGDVKIIGRLFGSTVAWLCDVCDEIRECIVCVYWEHDTNNDPDILIETYMWDRDKRMSVTVA